MKNMLKSGIALAVLGTFISVYAVVAMFAMNFSLGQVAVLLVGLLFLFGGLLLKIILARKVLKIMLWVFLAGVLLFVAMCVFLCCFGNNDTATGTEDAIIVLGCGVKGERVSLSLAARLDAAIEYWNTNQNAIIIVSGGQGPQEAITEALAMERYLLEKGIPADKIIKEEKSTSTYTNFVYSKEILDSRFGSEYKAVFVSNEYHLYRASRIAKQVGVSATHVHAETNLGTAPVAYSRECLAVIKNWVFGG